MRNEAEDRELIAFGERLRRHRRARGLTQRGLASAAGFSQKSIAAWEVGNVCPSAYAVALLARFFGLSMEVLWRGSDATQRSDSTSREAC